jgi:hypothetical protein
VHVIGRGFPIGAAQSYTCGFGGGVYVAITNHGTNRFDFIRRKLDQNLNFLVAPIGMSKFAGESRVTPPCRSR